MRNTLPRNILLAMLPIILAGIGITFHLRDVHEDYWGYKGKTPQGTIYSVQTVEHNLSAAFMPFTIARLLNEGRDSEIESYLTGTFGLTGYIVTRCDLPSTSDSCVNEKIIASTQTWWLQESGLSKKLEHNDFNILTNQHTPGIDWGYSAPKDESIIDQSFAPLGDVIGRIYYIRNQKPPFNSQLRNWFFVDKIFNSNSTDRKYYTAIIAAYISAGIVFSFVLNILLTMRLKQKRNQVENRYLRVSLEETEEVKKNLALKIGNLERTRLTLLDDNEAAEELIDETNLQVSTKIEALAATELALQEVKTELEIQKSKADEYKKKLVTRRVRQSTEEVSILNFLDGVNTLSKARISFSEEILSDDLPRLISQGIEMARLKNAVAKLVQVGVLGTFRPNVTLVAAAQD